MGIESSSAVLAVPSEDQAFEVQVAWASPRIVEGC